MEIVRFILAFFYLQPSLVITFIPLQIFLLAFFLYWFKKVPALRSIFISFMCVLLALLNIIGLGIFIVHFLYENFWEFIFLSWIESLLLVAAASCVYGILSNFFLRYIFKIRHVQGISWSSSAIAGMSVIGLYYLLWH